MLGKLTISGRPFNLDNGRHGPTALAVGAAGFVWTFFSRLSFLSSFSHRLGVVGCLIVLDSTAF